MKDFLELTKARKTSYQFTNNQIPSQHVFKILEAGRWAPSCLNCQPWHFILITEKKLMSDILNLCTYGNFHANPNMMVALVLDLNNWKNHYPKKSSRLASTQLNICIGMAASNIIHEATDLNIGSTLLTPNPKASKVLKLKNKNQVPLIIALGYSNKEDFQKNRARKKLKDILSYNYYKKNNQQEKNR